jgi:hypothetical protein
MTGNRPSDTWLSEARRRVWRSFSMANFYSELPCTRAAHAERHPIRLLRCGDLWQAVDVSHLLPLSILLGS